MQSEQEQTERTEGSATVSTLRSTASAEAFVASAATEDGSVASVGLAPTDHSAPEWVCAGDAETCGRVARAPLRFLCFLL